MKYDNEKIRVHQITKIKIINNAKNFLIIPFYAIQNLKKTSVKDPFLSPINYAMFIIIYNQCKHNCKCQSFCGTKNN